jgi:hypothetical protein
MLQVWRSSGVLLTNYEYEDLLGVRVVRVWCESPWPVESGLPRVTSMANSRAVA